MSLVSYAELTKRYRYFETFSQDNVTDDLLYYAEIEVNGRLASHFTVPFSDAHPTVKDLIMDMAAYRAYRIKDPKKAAELKDSVIGRIEDIKKGVEFIYTGSGTTIEPNVAEAVVWDANEDYHPVHSMLDGEYSFVNSDRLEAEEDERDI